MKPAMLMIVVFPFAAFLPLLTAAAQTQAAVKVDTDPWENNRPDMLSVQSAVIAELLRAEFSLAAVVKKTSQTEPVNAKEAMFRFCVFARAGMYEEARRAVDDLKRLSPDIDGYQLQLVFEAALDHFRKPDLAREIVEEFTDVEAFPGHNFSSPVAQLLDNMQEAGWNFDRVDQWLAVRPGGYEGFWVVERMTFNKKHGRDKELEKELTDGMRRNPEDIIGAINYLRAIGPIVFEEEHPGDLAWIGDLIHPTSAIDASVIAVLLDELQAPATAARFYRLAISTPLTEAEINGLGQGGQQGGGASNEVKRAGFAARTREMLANCLQALNQPDEARRWLKEAAEIREKYNPGNHSFGDQQQTHEQRRNAMEASLLAEEKAEADNPEYWLKRARHYESAPDFVKADHAFTIGLSLAPPRLDRSGKGNVDIRARLLSFYAGFLRKEKHPAEAAELLWKELAESPAMSVSCERAVSLLTQFHKEQVTIEHDVLWTWLGNRPAWRDIVERRLLEAMLANATPDEVDQALTRAEKLATGTDPARALVLGELENKLAFPQRSIALLEFAVQDKSTKAAALPILIDSFLDTADWQRAELSIREICLLYPFNNVNADAALAQWLSRTAVVANDDGHKTDAMRIWRQAANIDLTDTRPIEQLASAGLKEELIAFYREMLVEFPNSEVPPYVLELLVFENP